MSMRTHSQRGDIAIIVISIAIILGLIGLGFYAMITKSNAGANDTISANCQDLSLKKGDSNGTASTIYWRAVITNNGDRACRLTGYAAAFMNDSQAHAVPGTSNSLYPPTTVVLGPHGGQAHTIIGLPDPHNFPASTTCSSQDSSTLQLFLPGLPTPLTANFAESACPGFTITALQAGA